MQAIYCYIALGSNLDNPLQHISTAIAELAALPTSRLLHTSSLYQSPAVLWDVNDPPQPDYINAVVCIETRLSATSLLHHLHDIEKQHGRSRAKRWAARVLDLDLLLYGNAVIHTTAMTIPHPRLEERHFVVIPLFEIAPNLILPSGTPITILARHFLATPLKKLQT